MTEDELAEIFGGFRGDEGRGGKRAETAMAGCLYVQGIPDSGPWDPARLVYWAGEQVDAVFNPNVGDRKAHTAEELRETVGASAMRGGLPAIKVRILEGLEKAAMLEWARTSGEAAGGG